MFAYPLALLDAEVLLQFLDAPMAAEMLWFGNWAFPSFNVADSAITVGAALLIIDALFVSGRSKESEL